MQVVQGTPYALDASGNWMARPTYALTVDGLIPVGVDVRLASSALIGDAPWLAEMLVDVDDSLLPAGGLPASLLRQVAWPEQDRERELVVSQVLGDLYAHDGSVETVLAHLRAVADIAVERGMLKPGRRDLARSLFTLVEASPDARGERAAPSRRHVVERVCRFFPDFDSTELRATLQWARTHSPPLFSSHGERRTGGSLTRHAQRILILADPLDVLDPWHRNEILRLRARELPEFQGQW